MAKWSEKEAAVKSLERNGRVDPNDLIEAACDSGHPCHGDFTWDDALAGKERRRDQARKIIRTCNFQLLVDEVTTSVVSYVPSPDNDENTFTAVAKVRSKTKVSALLVSELAMLQGVVSRVYGIACAKRGMVGDHIAEELGTIRDQVAALKAEVEG